ncbi:MAG: cobalamin-dependent protein, partial [Desulfobulbaceae bacterium]|nr:cobalamin-dependent protein [Desulfobulbaceae bacterium]
RAMQGSMELLKPHLISADIKPRGTLVIGAVQGDLHDIGKNLVAMMTEGAGFQIKDLGTDVRPERFVEAVKETNASLVGLSALLTTTMPMKLELAALRQMQVVRRIWLTHLLVIKLGVTQESG